MQMSHDSFEYAFHLQMKSTRGILICRSGMSVPLEFIFIVISWDPHDQPLNSQNAEHCFGLVLMSVHI
jgi:hypothetical protein